MDDMVSLDGAQPTKHNRGGGVAPPHRRCVLARAEPRETEPAGGETIPYRQHTQGGRVQIGRRQGHAHVLAFAWAVGWHAGWAALPIVEQAKGLGAIFFLRKHSSRRAGRRTKWRT